MPSDGRDGPSAYTAKEPEPPPPGAGDGGGGEKQSVLRGDIHIMQQMYCIVHLPQSIVRELSSKSCDCFVEDAIRDT